MSVTFDDDTLLPNGGVVGRGAALLAQKLGLSDLVDEHRRSGW